MTQWQHKIKGIRDCLSDSEKWEDTQKSMSSIADILKTYPCFKNFNTKKFYKISKGNKVITPTVYANRLLDMMYDYADEHKIWID